MKSFKPLATAIALACASVSLSSIAADSFETQAKETRFVDVIVSLNVDAKAADRASNRAMASEIARQHGLSARQTYGMVFAGFAARVPENRLAELEKDPMVASISLDQEAHIQVAANQDLNSKVEGSIRAAQQLPWGVDRVDADLNANDGAGVHIYIIDTGIDSDHPDLAPNLGNGFAAVGCRGGGCATSWDDDNGHGSHVSGIAAAADNSVAVVGVAPAATLHAVKVLNRRGSGSFSDIIAGVDWVAAEVSARGVAAVANMSLGGGGSKTGTCTNSGFSGSDNFHRAICNAKNVGVVFAVAAGNDGADAQGSTPAAYDDAVVTVSATSIADDWPSWSNYGNDSASWTSNNSAPVGIAAPGVSVPSTWNNGGTNTISGTSMASPHVAGGMALILASTNQPTDGRAFTNVRSALLNTAESTNGFSNSSGRPHSEDFLDAGSL